VFYRRKIILALLEAFGGKLEKLRFQKLLFLLTTQQDIPSFEFIPYKYGCFSFQSYADLRAMTKHGQVREVGNGSSEYWMKVDRKGYSKELSTSDLSTLQVVRKTFRKCSRADLIRYTYKNFPYYAVNSTIGHCYLDGSELKIVQESRPRSNENVLFTIGYEGISLERYLNRLIHNDVKVLCDVRRNAFSMKRGFSKNQLKNACESIGIDYRHMPELGIASDKRRYLSSEADYKALFQEYRNTTLKAASSALLELLDLIKKNSRIALTCFEANINRCHRKHLADRLNTLHEREFQVRHI